MPTNDDLDYRDAIGAEFSAIPLVRLLNGDKRSAGNLFASVANTDTKKVLIENNTTDQALLLFEPTVRSSGQVFTQKVKNPTVDTEGDSATLVNAKTDDGTPLSVSVTTAGDGETGVLSGGAQYPELTAGSGSNPNNANPGESGETNISDVIMPGDALAVAAQNKSGGVQDISIVANFIALPTTELDRLSFLS